MTEPKIWNVCGKVVELIEAETAEEAINIFRMRLNKHGFFPYDGTSHSFDAFESEFPV